MKYAIVESGGKQFRAVEGGTIEVDRLQLENGAKVKLEQVLLIAEGENITVGTPVIKDNPVWTSVVEHFKGPKVVIFNYSPKKRIRVKTGHRQNYTRLLVEQIGGTEFVEKEIVKENKIVPAKSEGKKKPVEGKSRTVKAAGTKPAAKTTSKPAVKATPKKTTAAKASAKAASKPASKAAPKAASKKPAVKKK
jgi:large subunit ribosomal protein L21